MHSTQKKKLKALGSELTKDIKTGEDLSSLYHNKIELLVLCLRYKILEFIF
jgi:hypothetical protein